MNKLLRLLGIALITGACLILPAKAADGCKVILCLAGNWRDISQCRSDVEEALRDAARGRGWPSCGGVNTQRIASNTRKNCPPQYLSSVEDHNSHPIYTCAYAGVNTTTYQGRTFTRTYWNLRGGSVTQWSDEAKQMFRDAGMFDQLDLTFDLDYDEWLVLEEKRLKEEAERDQTGGGGA